MLVQICHIEGDNPGSARYRADQPDRERHGFSNLILLCGPHHKIIDDDEDSYTVERLKTIKAQAEAATPSLNAGDERAAELLWEKTIEHLEAIREGAPLLPLPAKHAEHVDVKDVAAHLSEMGIGVYMVLHDVPSKTLTVWVQIPGSTMAELKFKWAAVASTLSELPGVDHIDIGHCDGSPLRETDGRGRIGTMRVRIPIENARELAKSRRLRQEFWTHVSAFVVEPNVDNTGFQQWVKVPFNNLEVPLAAPR